MGHKFRLWYPDLSAFLEHLGILKNSQVLGTSQTTNLLRLTLGPEGSDAPQMSNKQASLENPEWREDCRENDGVWEPFAEGGVKECCWDGRGAWFIEFQLSNMWEKSSKNAAVSELKSSEKEMGLVGSEPLG